jgi:hypothetical protein bfra3_03771
MNVKFETLISVWDEQIPMLLINLVKKAVFTRKESEFRTAIRQLSESTDFDKFFHYGYGRSHFWLKQRLVSDPTKHMDNRLLIVEF